MNEEFKSLKVPAWVYDNAVAAQNEVMRRGIDALPPEALKPQQCPVCHNEVRFIEAAAEVKFARVECTHCSYKQQTVSLTGHVVAGVGLGMILGLGLYYLVEKINEPPPRRRSSKKRKAGVKVEARRRRAGR